MDVESGMTAAMEAVPSPLALMHAVRDAAGSVIDFEWDYINAAGAKEILVTRDELIGQRLLVKLPEHRDGLFDLYVNVVESGEPMEIVEAGYDDTWGTQSVIPRVYDIRSVKHEDGIIIWWSDVTERVASRVELERQAAQGNLLGLLIERSPVGMAKVNIDGTFTQVNPAFCTITGYEPQDLIGTSFVDITHPDDIGTDQAYVERLMRREIGSYVMDKRYIKPGGDTVWVRLHASSVWDQDENLETFVAQIADINDEKRLIEQLERSNHDLRQFAYVASHDLQTPLRLAGMYSELLFTEFADGALTAQQADYASELQTSLVQMRVLVRDLLEYSRVASANGSTASVDLTTVVASAVSQVHPMIDETDTKVRVDVPAGMTVMADESPLIRVIVNLLTNSIKYRHPERANEITIRARPAIGAIAEVSVVDNGVGIPQTAHDKAFAMFQRLQIGGDGTGIGLALVRSIVERWGGAVRIESDGDSGTTVIFTLPLA